MIEYQDIVSGEVVLSDAWPIITVNDGIFEVDLRKEGPEFDDHNYSDDETEQKEVKKEPTIVDAFELQEFQGYGAPNDTFLKTYMTYCKTAAKLQEQDQGLSNEVTTAMFNAAKTYLRDRKGEVHPDWERYHPRGDGHETSMPILTGLREDAQTVYLVYFRIGLVAVEKK